MLHRCEYDRLPAPPCCCGFLHGACGGGCAASSILLPMSGKQLVEGTNHDNQNIISSSSSVDCTLSLATPSTRQTAHKPSSTPIQRSSCTSVLRWNVAVPHSGKHTSRGTAGTSGGGGERLLLARRCANCDTTSTPLWRNGPRGPKSLCNACGIRYKKEERRGAASSPSPSLSSVATATAPAVGYTYHRGYASAAAGTATAVKSRKYEEFRVIREYGDDHQLTSNDEDDDNERESPYISWQLNVVRDRPSLVQYQ